MNKKPKRNLTDKERLAILEEITAWRDDDYEFDDFTLEWSHSKGVWEAREKGCNNYIGESTDIVEAYLIGEEKFSGEPLPAIRNRDALLNVLLEVTKEINCFRAIEGTSNEYRAALRKLRNVLKVSKRFERS